MLEIGPGRGALTRHLVGKVRRLVLVELDDDLARALAEQYAGRADVTVVHADVLDVRTKPLFERPAGRNCTLTLTDLMKERGPLRE